MTNRSVEVERGAARCSAPARMPAATSAACTIAVTEPLPLVPATCSEVKRALGMTERVAEARDVLETELDAEGLEREETVEQIRLVRSGVDGARATGIAGGATGAAARP